MRNKLFYPLALITLGFAIFTQSAFLRFLLGFEFLLWLGMFVWLWISRQSVSARITPPAACVRRDQEIPLEMALENRGKLPISHIRAVFSCRDEYSGQIRKIPADALLDSRDKATLRCWIRARHYGVITLLGGNAAICDPLGIHSARLPVPREQWQVAVLPNLQPEAASSDLSREVSGEGGSGSGFTDEPGSAYELRHYREGEPLRNVHWKLTAKTGQLMIREFEKETGLLLPVILDLSTGGKPFSREDWDAFLERVAAFACSRIREDFPFEFIWQGAAGLNRRRVCTLTDATVALTALVRERPQQSAVSNPFTKEDPVYEITGEPIRLNLWGEITQETF